MSTLTDYDNCDVLSNLVLIFSASGMLMAFKRRIPAKLLVTIGKTYANHVSVMLQIMIYKKKDKYRSKNDLEKGHTSSSSSEKYSSFDENVACIKSLYSWIKTVVTFPKSLSK